MADTGKSMTASEEVLGLLRPDALVTLYPLSVRVEDGQYIVGRIESGEFVSLPEVGGQVVKLFQEGYSLGEVHGRLQEEYGAEVDLEEFLADLAGLGFVKAVDGHLLGADRVQKVSLAWLEARHVRWVLSRPAMLISFALVVAAGITLLTHLELAPRHQHFFWSSTTSIVLLGNTAASLAIVALHELSHLVAARSLGVPARIGLGTRLQALVAQTNVSGLWAVPRGQRYQVYMAGMVFDLLIASIALLLLAYAPLATLAHDLLQVLVLMVFFGVLWQFLFFMRTDVYFVVMDLLRCRNLFEDSLAYLGYHARQLRLRILSRGGRTASAHPLEHIPPHERRKVRLYAWFVLTGSVVTLSLFAVYGTPILVELYVQAGSSAWRGIKLGQPWTLLDGIGTLLIQGAFQVVFVITFSKSHKGWFSSLRRAVTGR